MNQAVIYFAKGKKRTTNPVAKKLGMKDDVGEKILLEEKKKITGSMETKSNPINLNCK